MKYFFVGLLFFTGAILAATGMLFLFYGYTASNYLVSGILLIVFGGLFSLYARALMVEIRHYSEQMLADVAAAFRKHNGIMSKEEGYQIAEKNEKPKKVQRYFFLLEKSGDIFVLEHNQQNFLYAPHYQQKAISRCPFCKKNINEKEDTCKHCQADIHLLQRDKP